MNKRYLRIISLFLALLCIVSASAACADTGEDDKKDEVTTVQEETMETDPKKSLDNPDITFGNYVFRALSIDKPELYTQLDVDKPSAEVVSNAIYERNRKIEDKYEIKIECDLDIWQNTNSRLETQVKSGAGGGDDGGYDMIMLICRNAYPAALNNYLVNYDELTYVNIDKDYYFRDVNSQFSIGGKTFFAYGAESINVLGQADCLVFNKSIAQDHKLGDLYEMVNNKEWTYEVFFGMAETATKDLNGDGVEYGKDTIGLIGDYDLTIPAFWVSAGQPLISKDEDDYPTFSALGNADFIDVMQYSLGKLSTPSCFVYTANDGKYDSFMSNQALFYSGCVCSLATIKAMNTDYGVVPFPMYSTAQGKYYTRLVDGWIHCVPNTCMNPERTSIIMQALAYYSDKTVYDAYYSQALSAKYVRDEQSVEMLKLILSSLTVDLGDTVWYEKMRAPIVDTMRTSGASTNLASMLKTYKNPVKYLINKAIKFAETGKAD